jgi:hypothetical protein
LISKTAVFVFAGVIDFAPEYEKVNPTTITENTLPGRVWK